MLALYDTALSFLIVLIFSVWVWRLKRGMNRAPESAPSAEAPPAEPSPNHVTLVARPHAVAATHSPVTKRAASATAASRTVREGGVPTWTID